MQWFERDFEKLFREEAFLRRVRGEYAIADVNGAGIQERRAEMPSDMLQWFLAIVEAARWDAGEDRAAA